MIVRLPDLRDRPGDMSVLVPSLLDKAMAGMGKQVPGVSPGAMARLAAYGWPGNVRELQNEIQRMLVRGQEGEWLGKRCCRPIFRPHPPAGTGWPCQRMTSRTPSPGRAAI
jgi:two-component system response regulator HupR/HoxA